METLLLNVDERKIFGKKVKKLRKEGQIPAILYGHGIKPHPLSIKQTEFDKVFQKAGVSALIDLKIDKGQSKKVLIHEPQRDPKTLKPIHIDFYQVKMTEKITTEIPIKIVGESPIIKEMGGTLIANRDAIEVQCLPDELIHEIEVDVSNLKTFEDSIKISDLNISKDIEVLNDKEEVIVSVTPPMSEEELAELEAPVEEKVEEVEEVEKKEKEEGEEVTEEEKPIKAKEEKPSEEPEKIPEHIAEQPEKQPEPQDKQEQQEQK